MARRDRPRGAHGATRTAKGTRRAPRDHRDHRDAGSASQRASDAFTCGHCGRFVGPLPSGGHNRNHCPYCLYSRHVDAERSGDRASLCGGLMAPIGVFERPNGEEVIIHRCETCGFERFNRVGADDDEARVAALPRVAPRSARPPDGPPASSENEES